MSTNRPALAPSAEALDCAPRRSEIKRPRGNSPGLKEERAMTSTPSGRPKTPSNSEEKGFCRNPSPPTQQPAPAPSPLHCCLEPFGTRTDPRPRCQPLAPRRAAHAATGWGGTAPSVPRPPTSAELDLAVTPRPQAKDFAAFYFLRGRREAKRAATNCQNKRTAPRPAGRLRPEREGFPLDTTLWVLSSHYCFSHSQA